MTPAPARAPRVPRETERDFANAVVKLATLLHWRVYRTWNSIHSPAGYPDLTMTKGGRLIFAELKQVGKSPTLEQRMWLAALSAVPCAETFVWCPEDWGTITRVLRGQVA